MPKTTRMNREHCAFLKVEQRVCCRIPMEEASCWTWVRERRNEDVNWKPILKGDDVVDDSAMFDSVGAFVVEKPFCPRGACDNCFEIFRSQIKNKWFKRYIRIQGLHRKWIQIRKAIKSAQSLIRSNAINCGNITY